MYPSFHTDKRTNQAVIYTTHKQKSICQYFCQNLSLCPFNLDDFY